VRPPDTARLALEQAYPVVPVAAVGAEEMLDVIIDQDTPIYGQFAQLYHKLMGFPTPPIIRGVGATPIPRPERLYFWFGEPIDAAPSAAASTTRLPPRNSAMRSSGPSCTEFSSCAISATRIRTGDFCRGYATAGVSQPWSPMRWRGAPGRGRGGRIGGLVPVHSSRKTRDDRSPTHHRQCVATKAAL
jgi:hypothetical protein